MRVMMVICEELLCGVGRSTSVRSEPGVRRRDDQAWPDRRHPHTNLVTRIAPGAGQPRRIKQDKKEARKGTNSTHPADQIIVRGMQHWNNLLLVIVFCTYTNLLLPVLLIVLNVTFNIGRLEFIIKTLP